ncbi:hypothetical protein EDB89DRAFT_344913 [Lactarius sanguifluus]|nr:hypothetical protein EDB89DRAFT_344913 [Lactarius sanguifluus]
MSPGQFLLNAGGSRLHLASGDSPAFPYQPLDEMGKAKQETHPWSSYIWDSWNKSPEECNFLRRLDTCLITYAALSYFSKYLDQQNVTNAYVSGMQDVTPPRALVRLGQRKGVYDLANIESRVT